MNTSINHGEMPESFAPETVDEEIARYLGTEAQPEGAGHGARLIHALAGYHTLPPEADRSLESVRTRIRITAGASDASISTGHRDANLHRRGEPGSRPEQSQRAMGSSSGMRPVVALTTPLRAVAAVLVVALLLGGFVAVLHLRGGRQIVTVPTWQNVGIAREKVHGQPLDFDPASGVGYTISQSGGRIYAVGGTHLWYSDDGGATYRPFAPALPFIKNVKSYIISTVPGLRGVFASPGSVDNPGAPIFYAEAGAPGWSTLQSADAAHPIATPQSTTPIDPARIWKAIFYEYTFGQATGQNIQARAVGNWLFVLAGPRDIGATLIGTPDFGATWYDLSATMPEPCMQFAVNPVDARQLFCLTTSSIEQTADGGLTWKQVMNASPPGTSFSLYTSIWASARAVYSYTYSSLNTPTPNVTPPDMQLAHHPLGVGNWATATLYRMPQGNGAVVIDVSPGDTVYALAGSVTAGLESQTQVQASVLASGARQFVPVGEETTLSIPGNQVFFELGNIYSTDTPAIYAHALLSAQTAATQPLYRLALPRMDVYPQQEVTPLATPPLSATSTPVLHPACTSTPGVVANIQNGGFGANYDTFARRWGASGGVAAGSEIFGQWSDGTPKVQIADALPSNHRVYQMSYHVDKAQAVTEAQGEVLAKSILPKDATPVGRSQQDNELIVTYCSAAIIAAFPPSVQDINGPLPHNGLIAVNYALRTDGNVEAIAFTPMQ